MTGRREGDAAEPAGGFPLRTGGAEAPRRFTALFLASFLLLLLFDPARAARTPFERLFGREPLPATAQNFPADVERQWRRVLEAETREPSLGLKSSRLPAPHASHWLYFAGKASRMEETELLRGVNAFFNRFPPASDEKNYGMKEHWASPAEFFRHRSGDCEDYVLAKYFTLRLFGLPDDSLRIVLGYDERGKQHHAVLAVRTKKGVYILDNNVRPGELILPQEKYLSRFTPLYMLNAGGRWTFGPAGGEQKPSHTFL
jgi:predicted transglutaminase-like cysteine proteinase